MDMKNAMLLLGYMAVFVLLGSALWSGVYFI